MNLLELQNVVEALGEKKYRGAQLFRWLYAKGARTFGEMTNISQSFKEVLEASSTIENLDIVNRSESIDGTIKFLLRLVDGASIECVLIPPERESPGAANRLTLCVSTQVGCPLDCKFCATGTMGFTRNLTAGEIVDQVLLAQRQSQKRISNLVFMGMGEPMLNYDNVLKAVGLLNDDAGLNIGARHITISTAGYADKIRQLADDHLPVKLALSLHTLDNEKRLQLMPITKKYSVQHLLEALEYYFHTTGYRPTIEYILFDHFNDTENDVARLAALGKRIPCKINLIPFHSIHFTAPTGFAATLQATPPERIEQFARALRNANLTVMVRSSSGRDIQAACGQLAISHEQP